MTEPDKVEFSGLVLGLATSAATVLGQVEVLLQPGGGEAGGSDEEKPATPEEVKKRVSEGLKGARNLIDTLAMLEEKTQGNLTDEEGRLLRDSLAELRLRFVSLSGRPIPQASKKADEDE